MNCDDMVEKNRKSLRDLGSGDIFLIGADLYALLMGYEDGKKLLGRDPPSLPLAKIEGGGDSYRLNGHGLLVLGSSSDVDATGYRMDSVTVANYLGRVRESYKRSFEERT